jgi:hypothetical protein
MAEIVSRREQIVAEFKDRLAAEFPASTFERGLVDDGATTSDKFYLLDLPEACDLSDRHRGMYHCVFTISISYWIQAAKEDVFPLGNFLMERIRLAIETDERLNGLVISYHLDEGALVWYDEGMLNIEMLFIVEYVKDAGWVRNPFKKP